MRKYKIAATMKGEDDKVYGHELEVDGPSTVEEFIQADGNQGVLDVLQDNFRHSQVAILRGRLAKALGKTEKESGGRLANAIRLDLE